VAPAVRKGSAGVAASLGSTGSVYTVPDDVRAVKMPGFLPLYRLWCRNWSTVSTLRMRPWTLRSLSTSCKGSARHGMTIPLAAIVALLATVASGALVATGATVIFFFLPIESLERGNKNMINGDEPFLKQGPCPRLFLLKSPCLALSSSQLGRRRACDHCNRGS